MNRRVRGGQRDQWMQDIGSSQKVKGMKAEEKKEGAWKRH